MAFRESSQGQRQPWEPAGSHGVPNLTLVLVACNEGETIERLFESLRPIRPEVVVSLDRESTDATRQIALRYAHHLTEHTFDGDFASLRNHAIQQATGTWCITLDGHEFLQSPMAERLNSYIHQAQAKGLSALACRLSLGTEEGQWISPVLRVWRRSPQIKYVRPIHEQLTGVGAKVLGCPDLVISHRRSLHHATLRSTQRHHVDLPKLSAWAAANPEDAETWLQMAELACENNDTTNAIAYCAQALSVADRQNPILMARLYNFKASLSQRMGDHHSAYRSAHLALADVWHNPTAHAIAVRSLADQDRWQEALSRLSVFGNIDSHFELPVRVPFLTWWPPLAESWLLWRLGAQEASHQRRQRAITLGLPNDTPFPTDSEHIPWP